MIQSNPDAPHRAVIWLYAEVHEMLKTGECSGSPVHKVRQFPIVIDGSNREEAIQKLEQLLKELKAR